MIKRKRRRIGSKRYSWNRHGEAVFGVALKKPDNSAREANAGVEAVAAYYASRQRFHAGRAARNRARDRERVEGINQRHLAAAEARGSLVIRRAADIREALTT